MLPSGMLMGVARAATPCAATRARWDIYATNSTRCASFCKFLVGNMMLVCIIRGGDGDCI